MIRNSVIRNFVPVPLYRPGHVPLKCGTLICFPLISIPVVSNTLFQDPVEHGLLEAVCEEPGPGGARAAHVALYSVFQDPVKHCLPEAGCEEPGPG